MARARIFLVLGGVFLLASCGSSGSKTGQGGQGGTATTGVGGGAGTGGSAGTSGAGGQAAGGAAGSEAAGGAAGGSAGGTGATGGNTGGGAGGAATGGQAGAGGGAAGGAGGNPGSKVGMITATQTISGGSTSASAVATFTQMTTMNPCVPTTTGNCRLYACPSPGTPSPKTHFQAGTVGITGLATPISLSYSSGPQMYVSDSITGLLWAASRPATATVSGSTDVPAVTLNVTGPNPITPVMPAGPPYTISKSADLLVG